MDPSVNRKCRPSATVSLTERSLVSHRTELDGNSPDRIPQISFHVIKNKSFENKHR